MQAPFPTAVLTTLSTSRATLVCRPGVYSSSILGNFWADERLLAALAYNIFGPLMHPRPRSLLSVTSGLPPAHQLLSANDLVLGSATSRVVADQTLGDQQPRICRRLGLGLGQKDCRRCLLLWVEARLSKTRDAAPPAERACTLHDSTSAMSSLRRNFASQRLFG